MQSKVSIVTGVVFVQTTIAFGARALKTISKIHYSGQQRSKAIRLPNELHENAFRNHLHLRNAPDQPKGRPTFAMAVCKCLWEVIIRGKLIFPLTFKLRSEASSDSS